MTSSFLSFQIPIKLKAQLLKCKLYVHVLPKVTSWHVTVLLKIKELGQYLLNLTTHWSPLGK